MAEINKRIGERIRDIRQQKMMTQQELCSDVISRNMLSCIENGTANPSINTLLHIAKSLNIPAGFLISEEDDSFVLQKFSVIDDVHQAYKNGAYAICIDLCRKLDKDDDEIALVLSRSYLMIGKEAFFDGNLRDACIYLDNSLIYAQKSVYSVPSVIAEVSCYFRQMKYISSTLRSDILDDDRTWQDDISAIYDEFCRYTYFTSVMQSVDASLDFEFADLAESFKTDFYERHIKALRLMREKNFSEALSLLKELIYGQEIFPKPILYNVLRQAELCSRNIEDYKSAYEFSNSAITVLDSLLK